MDLNFSIVVENLPYLIKASLVTLKFTFLSFIFAMLIALIVGILRSLKIPKALDAFLGMYVEIFRGSPLLVQLFLIYYGLPSIGITMKSDTAAIIGLALNSGAYMSEIIRSAILSVDRGQSEAAHSFGFTGFQTMVHIIIPQAMKVAVPPLMNAFSGLLKDSSLISVISITELTRTGNLIYSKTYRPFEIYLTLGLFYFLMTYAVSIFSKLIEKKSSRWSI